MIADRVDPALGSTDPDGILGLAYQSALGIAVFTSIDVEHRIVVILTGQGVSDGERTLAAYRVTIRDAQEKNACQNGPRERRILKEFEKSCWHAVLPVLRVSVPCECGRLQGLARGARLFILSSWVKKAISPQKNDENTSRNARSQRTVARCCQRQHSWNFKIFV